MITDMDNFTKLVKSCYKDNSGEEISNCSIEHAEVLAEYLFNYAKEKKKDVKIITGELNKDFYDKLNISIKAILKHNKVSIISVKTPEDSEFKQEIEESSNGNIKTINKEDKVSSLPHFILVGDSAYRLETDDKLKLATASFNNPGVGKFLSGIFDRFNK